MFETIPCRKNERMWAYNTCQSGFKNTKSSRKSSIWKKSSYHK